MEHVQVEFVISGFFTARLHEEPLSDALESLDVHGYPPEGLIQLNQSL